MTDKLERSNVSRLLQIQDVAKTGLFYTACYFCFGTNNINIKNKINLLTLQLPRYFYHSYLP